MEMDVSKMYIVHEARIFKKLKRANPIQSKYPW